MRHCNFRVSLHKLFIIWFYAKMLLCKLETNLESLLMTTSCMCWWENWRGEVDLTKKVWFYATLGVELFLLTHFFGTKWPSALTSLLFHFFFCFIFYCLRHLTLENTEFFWPKCLCLGWDPTTHIVFYLF